MPSLVLQEITCQLRCVCLSGVFLSLEVRNLEQIYSYSLIRFVDPFLTIFCCRPRVPKVHCGAFKNTPPPVDKIIKTRVADGLSTFLFNFGSRKPQTGTVAEPMDPTGTGYSQA